MKRPIALLLLVFALLVTALYQYKFPVAPPSPETVFIQTDIKKQPVTIKVPVMTELGIPTAEQYSVGNINSRNPWDMEAFDGGLFVGCGDYDKNTGPCTVWRYDLKTAQWQNSGTVDDEAVANFEFINGQLVITGTDPKSNWDFGSFYSYTADGWQTDRTVPFGVHMFDIAEFDGKLFYGIGTSSSSQSPVQLTIDGDNYINVPFFIDNTAVLDNSDYSFMRCYNLFEGKNELYAFCFFSSNDASKTPYGFFRFDGQAFHLVSTIRELGIKGNTMSRQVPLSKAVTLNGKHYFSTGQFYTTNDFVTVNTVPVPDNADVRDLVIENGKLYILTTQKTEVRLEAYPDGSETEEGETKTVYKNAVWEYSEENGFSAIHSFEYGLSAMSLVKHDDVYYIGIGDNTDTADSIDTPKTEEAPLNGMILKLEFSEKIIYE